jgi:hypothetical protein
MNYVACGIRVVVAVNPDSEAAPVDKVSGGGTVSDAARPEDFAGSVARMQRDRGALETTVNAGFQEHFPPDTAQRFEGVLDEAVAEHMWLGLRHACVCL